MSPDEFCEKLCKGGYDSGSLHDGVMRVLGERIIDVQCNDGIDSLLTVLGFLGITPQELFDAVEAHDKEGRRTGMSKVELQVVVARAIDLIQRYLEFTRSDAGCPTGTEAAQILRALHDIEWEESS